MSYSIPGAELPIEASGEGSSVQPRRRLRPARVVPVSLQHQDAARLEARLAELERSNAELEAFAYTASHDLREPLRTIGGFADLLARRHGEALGPEGLAYLGYMGDAVRRMEGIVEDLLDLARVSAAPPRREPVDLAEVVARSVRCLASALEGGDAEVEIASSLPVVYGDEGQLEQVVCNLLANGLKFAAGAGRPRVRIASRPAPEGWLLTVTDDGPGVPAEEAERIFAPFHRLARDKGTPGTGLGLAICRRIVEHHGGRIWVEPGPDGRGSRFCVLLAVRESDRAPAAAAAAA